MKTALFALIALTLMPMAHALGLGASPSRLEWESTEYQTLLLFNPGERAVAFAMEEQENGSFIFEPQKGMVAAHNHTAISIRPRALRNSTSHIYARIESGTNPYGPALAIESRVNPPAKPSFLAITGSIIGSTSMLAAAGLGIAVLALVIIYGALRKN